VPTGEQSRVGAALGHADDTAIGSRIRTLPPLCTPLSLTLSPLRGARESISDGGDHDL